MSLHINKTRPARSSYSMATWPCSSPAQLRLWNLSGGNSFTTLHRVGILINLANVFHRESAAGFAARKQNTSGHRTRIGVKESIALTDASQDSEASQGCGDVTRPRSRPSPIHHLGASRSALRPASSDVPPRGCNQVFDLNQIRSRAAPRQE